MRGLAPKPMIDGYSEEFLHAAHRHSTQNKQYFALSAQAGCFHCCSVYPASQVIDWITDDVRYTAKCPKCGVDAVIPSSREPLVCDTGFLSAMNTYWFGND